MSHYHARRFDPAPANAGEDWCVVDARFADERHGKPNIISHHNNQEEAEAEAERLNREAGQ
ncbi:hypothetical protein [Chromohalobacter israelensis]|uniref:hypothetical protein n=1 Tax=Chromohalobacter israelensis TaxID=141390 RepID=UPI000FFF0E7C|nr:hypothetical protein [Chromohalobacter salexigens]RXE48714.1 hypothetical protein B4O83_12345 [Chromohalobacter salexigens]